MAASAPVPLPRVIHRVHELPGRLRLRLAWLRETPEFAPELAETLARLHPSMEVEVRPFTGSVLCRFEPGAVDPEELVAAVRRHTGVAIVTRKGERSPEAETEYRRGFHRGASGVTRALSETMREINEDVMARSGGRLDLGALTGLGFLTAGAAEIAVTRKLPAPPWFNLAWWAFRTFTLFGEAEDGEADNGEPQRATTPRAARESSEPE